MGLSEVALRLVAASWRPFQFPVPSRSATRRMRRVRDAALESVVTCFCCVSDWYGLRRPLLALRQRPSGAVDSASFVANVTRIPFFLESTYSSLAYVPPIAATSACHDVAHDLVEPPH